MHAARLVEYSDSDEDEEHQWREFHKQRTTLRMPSGVGGAAAGVRSASFQASVGVETASPSTGGEQQQGGAAPSQVNRDYAFTPRKRSSFLRSTASSSPYARKGSSSPLSPQVDFSFSYPPNSTSASPMSDEESKPFVWAQSSFQSQKNQNGCEKSAGSRPHIFTFGSVKTEQSDAATSSEASTEGAPGSGGFQSTGPSPFKFDAFFKTVEAKPTPSSAASPSLFQAPDLGRAGSRDVRADSKTPQRQKDLHRAAKRRVSGGGSEYSGFGGVPSASVSTPTPFSFVSSTSKVDVDAPSTPARKILSPMDIQMDETAAVSPSPAFTFGMRTPPPSAKSSASFVFGSTSKQTKDSSRRSTSSRPKRSGMRNGNLRVDGREDATHDPKKKDEPFVFGSTNTSSFSTNPSFVDPAPSTASFAFGSSVHRSSMSASNSKSGSAPPLERKTSSFTFEAAFKEFKDNAQEFQPAASAPSNATRNSAAKREDASDAAMFSASHPSLAARLQRRRQARESQTRSTPRSASSGSDTAPQRGAAQKSLFGSARASEPAPSGMKDPFPVESNPFTPFNSSSSFTFGSDQLEPKKMTTNVFHKPSTASNSSAGPATSCSWSFDPPTSQARATKETVFENSQFNQGGVFSFGRASAVPAPPEPGLGQHPRPVENLKSNFDGFNIGLTSAERSKSARAKPGARKPAPASKSSSSEQKVRSPFGMSAPSEPTGPFQAKPSAFVGTPPADPFVTPTFGQKKNAHEQEPKAKQGLDSRFAEFSTSPFAPTSHTATSPSSGFSFQDGGAEQANSGPFSNPFSFSGANMAFVGHRRIVRAARPVKKAQPTSANPGVGGEEDTHRKWSDWKLLGGEAYSNREYQQAADCYLNSTDALETLLAAHPEIRTAQLMKDKAKLHSNRAAALMMLLQMSDAQRECHLSIESDPGYTRAYLRLGRVQVLMGDVDGAKESAKTAKQLLSLDEGSRNWRDSNDMAGVKKIELGVENLERLLGEIKWCLDVHDYSNALVHLNEALAIAPSSRSLQTQKAQVLYDQKNYSQVIDYCAGVIRKQKSNNRSPARAQTAPASSAEDPNSDNDVALLGIELSLLRIRALHHEKKEEEAMQQMQKLELAAPVSEKVIQLKRLLHDMKELKHQANTSFKDGDYAKAQQLYTQALELDPTHDEYCAVLYCNRAAALMGLHQYENALHDCNAALRRKARYPRGLLRRARCNVALKRYAAAIADFDRYLKDARVEDASSAGSFVDIAREKQIAEQAMEKEAQERKRQEEQQKKERQRNYGRAKSQQQQQQRRNSRHAWDDSKFYEEFWRSSSTGGASSSRNQQSSSGAKSNRGSAAAHNKHQRTHYEVLGITKSATQDEIKKAYRKLALLHHPDKAKDTVHADLFKDMTAAYSVLSDPTARAKYDREIQYSGYGRYYEY